MKKFDYIEYDTSNFKVIAKDGGSAGTPVETKELKTDKWLKIKVDRDGSLFKIEMTHVESIPNDLYVKVEKDKTKLAFGRWDRGQEKIWAASFIGIDDDRPGLTGIMLNLQTQDGIYLKRLASNQTFSHFEATMKM